LFTLSPNPQPWILPQPAQTITAAANLVYRCALAPRGVEERVVLARIHANRGAAAGDDADDAEGNAGGPQQNGGPGEPGSPVASRLTAAEAEALNHDAAHSGGDGIDDGVGGDMSLFDRREEIATFSAVSSAGLGPQLLLLFQNGRLEEFLVE
jgi:hypothetical protein